MPRRRPGRVRAELPRSRPAYEAHEKRAAVDGWSAGTVTGIRRLEQRKSYLWTGAVAQTLGMWREFVHRPNHRLTPYDSATVCSEWLCCGDPWEAREYLEAVLRCLPRRSARELRRVVGELDELY